MIALEAELDTLLAPPHVFGSVFGIIRKPFELDGVQKLLMVESETKRVSTNTIAGASSYLRLAIALHFVHVSLGIVLVG